MASQDGWWNAALRQWGASSVRGATKVGRSVGRSSCLSASVCPNLVLPLWQLIMDGDLSAFFFFMNILRITTKHTIATLFFYAGCGLRF